MSGVSTASAPVGIAALLGGAPEGTGFGGPAARAPSSFGAALALAERMLDAGADPSMPTDAAAAASSEGEGAAESADAAPPVDGEHHSQAGPDAALPPVIAALTAPPITPAAEPAEDVVPAEDSLPPDAQAASNAHAADVPQGMDADAPVIPIAVASAANVRAGDPPPPVASPAVSVPPSAASDASIARAELVPAQSAAAASDAVPVAAVAPPAPKEGGARPDHTATPTPATPAPAVTVSPTSTPVVTAPDAAAAAPRAVAAQVAPVVLSIVQRPVGSHQLTMTVTPDTLGPVTVRAHISAGGEVRVELLGATDAGRDALRTIVTDLRRDLAAVMPHASLVLGSSTAADAGSPDRGAQPGAGGTAGDQAAGGRERSHAPSDPRSGADSALRGNPRSLPITTRAVSGEGLDIFA